jgi:hypothetical protein
MNMFWGHKTQRQQQQMNDETIFDEARLWRSKRQREKEHESALKMCKIEIRDLWPVIINL